jgi:hypothetical protein
VIANLTWYVTRASGLVAWAVVTLAIVWGLVVSTRVLRREVVLAPVLDMHRFLGALSLVFVAVHVGALWADSYVQFGPRELFVPMASAWRPDAVAWGIAATYLLVAIEVTSWFMRRLPRALWHRVHLLSFPMFAFATVHGFASGSEAMNVAVQWCAATSVLAVLFLAALRVSNARALQSAR